MPSNKQRREAAQRRLQGRSSGDAVSPKRPDLGPLTTDDGSIP